jgi:hypothetical protein
MSQSLLTQSKIPSQNFKAFSTINNSTSQSLLTKSKAFSAINPKSFLFKSQQLLEEITSDSIQTFSKLNLIQQLHLFCSASRVLKF